MLIYLENRKFIIGKLNQVLDFLLKSLNETPFSKIILPCSLNDLALQNEVSYKLSYQEIDFCTSDSMFLTYFFRHKYKTQIDRVYGPDLMLAILNKNKKSKFKHFFIAPNVDTMKKIKLFINQKYPKMKCDFDFLPKDISSIKETYFLKKVIANEPNFIWLGVGSPKQIKLAAHLKENSSGIGIFCVGAALDFLSGNQKQAPVFLQKNGLEWLFRLLSEPRRLWRRYLIIIPKYLISFLFKQGI